MLVFKNAVGVRWVISKMLWEMRQMMNSTLFEREAVEI